MQRRISGFHQDEEAHWVADLECGHTQHVRHEPLLTSRPWVLDPSSRQAHLGTFLNCLRCDEPGPADDRAGLSPKARAIYDDARLRGLCHEGAMEAARGA